MPLPTIAGRQIPGGSDVLATVPTAKQGSAIPTTLIDSHAHLDARQFKSDLPAVLRRARAVGVEIVVTVGLTPASSRGCLGLATRWPEVHATVGFHPHWASGANPERMAQARQLARDPAAVAVGEIGLDYRRMRSPKPAQLSLFHDMLAIASEVALPVVIHDGQAHADVRETLSTHRKHLVGGIIHCFSGDWKLAKTYLDWGFFLSIPGSVTYPRFRQMREVAAMIPLDRLLVETDAPHLTPSQADRRRNEPAYVQHTAREVAELRGMSFSDLARAVTANAIRALNLPPS